MDSKHQACEDCSHQEVCNKRVQYKEFKEAVQKVTIAWGQGVLALKDVPGLYVEAKCGHFTPNKPIMRGLE